MKKIISVILTLAMMAVFSVSVAAAPGKFVQSPSTNPAVVLVDGSNENDACEAEVVVVPYAQRAELETDARTLIESTYDLIVKATDLTTFNADLKKLVADKKIPAENLAVSDLFDVSWVGCDDHRTHGTFTIKLKAETLKNFVGLIHYNNGKWDLIANAKVSGDTLTFEIDEFSPFAIVVNTDPEGSGTPETGDSFPWLYVVMLAVSGTGLVVLGISSIRSRKEH